MSILRKIKNKFKRKKKRLSPILVMVLPSDVSDFISVTNNTEYHITIRKDSRAVFIGPFSGKNFVMTKDHITE